LAGVPAVLTSEHGENPGKGPVRRWIERQVISRLADMRFCVSPQILAKRRDVEGIPEAKLILTVNGTVLKPFSAKATSNAVPIIGSVGRFISAKDYPGLLRAIADLRNRGYELALCLVGDGPDADQVRAIIDKLNLHDVVQLPGLVMDIDNWYRRFDLYVSSSVREGLAVALLEAMAHGLPVVATDVGASAETVGDGDAGLIVPPGDPGRLADAIARLLDDPSLRATLGQNARNRIVHHYSVESVAEFHENTYRDLLLKRVGTRAES
jgi:glycosyltransferase involved in cell wall biosynthesis